MKGFIKRIANNGTQIIEIVILVLCSAVPFVFNATELFAEYLASTKLDPENAVSYLVIRAGNAAISAAIFFIVFFMIFVLDDMKGKTGMGVGIGLFGIFSIMRYRTDSIHVREMTYMFVIIALAVVNAIATSVSIAELLLTNVLFVVAIYLVEKVLRQYPVKLVQYDRIELVKPERRKELVADLEERLGLQIIKVEVGAIDFLRDMAMVRIYYQHEGIVDKDLNEKIKLKNTDYANI